VGGDRARRRARVRAADEGRAGAHGARDADAGAVTFRGGALRGGGARGGRADRSGEVFAARARAVAGPVQAARRRAAVGALAERVLPRGDRRAGARRAGEGARLTDALARG